ncbi:type VI secretion system Vgr family domain protein [Escherichia coli]|nr:type VI secretion system Vgr family domain protein [Escherichia coli]MCW7181297.1 type VI secretion system Vgr family domain protein [Escherichia coli]
MSTGLRFTRKWTADALRWFLSSEPVTLSLFSLDLSLVSQPLLEFAQVLDK